jgi:hypothetical protein
MKIKNIIYNNMLEEDEINTENDQRYANKFIWNYCLPMDLTKCVSIHDNGIEKPYKYIKKNYNGYCNFQSKRTNEYISVKAECTCKFCGYSCIEENYLTPI